MAGALRQSVVDQLSGRMGSQQKSRSLACRAVVGRWASIRLASSAGGRRCPANRGTCWAPLAGGFFAG